MRQPTPLLVLTVLLVATASTSAIIRRHDRDDAAYLKLGAGYPCVTRLGGGTATLIAPRWLLTAGHVATNLSPFDRSVHFNGRDYPIRAVLVHPKSRQRPRTAAMDVALIQLAEPVEGVAPATVYSGRQEKGMNVVFVGPGMFGDGMQGPVGDDARMRGATNIVADALDNYLTFSFDAPPHSTELEGISGPGDSGGPALCQIDHRAVVVGVSSANDPTGAAGPCRYGSTEYYARVSTVAEWITTTMATDPAPRALPADPIDIRDGHCPDSPAGRIAGAFFEAYGRGDDQAMESFERTFRAEKALKDRPVAERVQSWRKLHAEWGPLKAHKYIQAAPTELHVLVRAEGEGVWKSFRFETEPEPPHRLLGISIASPVAGN